MKLDVFLDSHAVEYVDPLLIEVTNLILRDGLEISHS